MPRGANHLDDSEVMRDLYREFDLEDLARIVCWMHDISERTFTIKQACALSGLYTGGAVSILYQHGGQWGKSRVRRVLRVGVELGWLLDNGRARSFTITDRSVSAFPTMLKAATQIARSLGRDRDLVRASWIDMVKQTFEENRK